MTVYCSKCFKRLEIPEAAAMPEKCPHCEVAPLVVQSWQPQTTVTVGIAAENSSNTGTQS